MEFGYIFNFVTEKWLQMCWMESRVVRFETNINRGNIDTRIQERRKWLTPDTQITGAFLPSTQRDFLFYKSFFYKNHVLKQSIQYSQSQ